MFSLLRALDETPESVPSGPYLWINPQWEKPIRDDGRKRIGIAWSSERAHAVERLIPLAQLIAALGECQLYGLQNHAQDEGEPVGVQMFRFTDFAELAALMARMDAIVSIDTAALNLAGAIGHPKVNALLPFAPVWRWHNPRWYPQINQCRQIYRGDWASALAQLKL
jgi:ADP-heptose:LPS heptosyltransferase